MVLLKSKGVASAEGLKRERCRYSRRADLGMREVDIHRCWSSPVDTCRDVNDAVITSNSTILVVANTTNAIETVLPASGDVNLGS